jgi:nitrogen fixation protein FixH
MAKGNVATQNQIPSNSTSRRVVLYVFTYFGVLYVVSVDLRFFFNAFISFKTQGAKAAVPILYRWSACYFEFK